jgi:hypothetical protein
VNQPARDQLQIAQAARTIALQMLEERGRGAVLVGVARVDVALERLLQAVLLPTPGPTDSFFQPDRPLGSFGARITLAARMGQSNPIWPPLERILQEKVVVAGTPLDPALRDYLLLITILVGLLEAAAQQLRPQPPQVVKGFTGLSQ